MEVNPILLDTNAYAAFKRGDGDAVEIIRNAPSIGINTVILGELLAGFATGSRNQDNRRQLEQFLDSPRVTTLPLVSATAECYANIFAQMKAAGTPIPTNDMWIGASALEHGFHRFTHDQHFRSITGLRIGRTIAEFSHG